MPLRKGNPRSFRMSTRQVGDLWLVFWDKDTVYAQKGKVKVLYHRYYNHEHGFYTKHWRKFTNYASDKRNHPTIPKLNELAALHEINITVPRAMPILPPWEREEDES